MRRRRLCLAALALVAAGALALPVVALLNGCAWIEAHDPPVQYEHGPGCHDLGDEPCGTGGCCYGWQDYHCEPIAQRCEYHHDTMSAAPRDAGADR